MIIWRGFGILALVIVIITFAIGGELCRVISQNNNYYQQHSWPVTISLILAGIICWFLGKYLNRPQNGRVYIDKESGKEVQLRKVHTLFFIKIEYWGIIYAIFGLMYLFMKR